MTHRFAAMVVFAMISVPSAHAQIIYDMPAISDNESNVKTVPYTTILMSDVKQTDEGVTANSSDAILMSLAKPQPQIDDEALDDMSYDSVRWDPKILEHLKNLTPKFLPITFVTGIAPPSVNSSLVTRRELVDLLMMQVNDRTSKSRFLITLENSTDYNSADWFALHGAIPAWPQNEALWVLLDAVDAEVSWFLLRDKARFSRSRPSDLEPLLVTLLPDPGHPAYPSGHAGQSQAIAAVLGRINPTCDAEYKAIALDIGTRREIAGLHFRSDSVAGRTVADAVVNALFDGGYLDEMLADVEAESGPIPTGGLPCRIAR